MKLTYRNNNGSKIVAIVNGRLTKDGRVELTSMEALKLAASLLLNKADMRLGFGSPVTLDREAEEMVDVEGFDVKSNGGPNVGVKVMRIPADIGRFTGEIVAAFDCVTFTDETSAVEASDKKADKSK